MDDNKTKHEISGSVTLTSEGEILLLIVLGDKVVALDIDPMVDGFYKVNSIRFDKGSDIEDVKPEKDALFARGDAAKFIEFVSSFGLNFSEDFHKPMVMAYEMGWKDPAETRAWRDKAVADYHTPPSLPLPCDSTT